MSDTLARVGSRRVVVAAIACTAVVVGASPILIRAAGRSVPYACPPCRAASNAYVRVDFSPWGTWSMGTTGGDPDTPRDDNAILVYGFKPGGFSDIGSGYPTVRIIGPRGATDSVPTEADTRTQAQSPTGDRVVTAWAWTEPHRTAVTQTLTLATNPFSGRPDTALVEYEVRNEDSVTISAGVRAMIDVKLGLNDGAPYIVPGVGAIASEREFVGESVPPFWLAFESPEYDPAQLRAVGILRGETVTSPDRVIIAYWVTLRDNLWEYAVNPTQTITRDSAVAVFWEPRLLAPGESRVVRTSYGIAGNRGGSVFLTSPNTSCGSVVPVSLFVSNFEGTSLTGGYATLSLPAGLGLAAGETATKPIGPIDPGETASSVWQVVAAPDARGDYDVTALATFAGGRDYSAQHVLRVDCDAPTPTPTGMPTSPATPSPTPSPTPESRAEVCDFLLPRVPPAAIAQAVAEPDKVGGWGLRCQPNLPPSPFNVLRDRLSMSRPSAPYHPQFNPLVYKCQCP